MIPFRAFPRMTLQPPTKRAQHMRIAPLVLPSLSAMGALIGIAGTAVLAFQHREVTTVFTLYLISNLAWIAVGLKTRQLWLMLMNVVYMALAVYGLLR
jgi:hypothetical protein